MYIFFKTLFRNLNSWKMDQNQLIFSLKTK